MTPTDKERQAVANRLRAYTHDFDFMDSDPFWYIAKSLFGNVDFQDCCNVFDRLADLIDPTCRNTLPQNWGTFECSKCGMQFEVSSVFMTESGNDDSEPIIPNYCPNCGARVVSDDAQ